MRDVVFQDVSGVILGGCLGHALCTGLAVLGGRIISQKISARTGKYSSYNTIHKSYFIVYGKFCDLNQNVISTIIFL